MTDEPQNGGLEVAPDPPPEEIRQTAPIFPWEVCLRQSVHYFQRRPNGGMAVKFAPGVKNPAGGVSALPPGFEVIFDAKGWERFQREVANDGETGPEIQTAKSIPHLRPAG